MPALLTRMSSWPSAASAAGTSASTAAVSERSQGRTCDALAQLGRRAPRAPRARVPDSATVAPCACSARAMAPPMPPVAPVTSAVCAGQSNMMATPPSKAAQVASRLEGLDVGGRADGDAASRLRRDALGQAGQHLAGAESRQNGRRRLRAMKPHAFAPAHRAGHLLDQQLADLVGVGDRRRQRHWRPAAPRAPGCSTSASAAAMASAAGCISAQWKGADTGSSMARLAPLRLGDLDRRARRRPWRRRSRPGRRHCRWRPRRRSPVAAGLGGDRRAGVRDRAPSSAAMAPSPTGTAFCMAWPRRRSSRAASASVNAPAAASAEYSPSEWPATNWPSLARSTPASASSTRSDGEADGHQRRLGVLGQGQRRPRGPRTSGGQLLRRAPRRPPRRPRAAAGRPRRAPCPCRRPGCPARERRMRAPSKPPSHKRRARRTRGGADQEREPARRAQGCANNHPRP